MFQLKSLSVSALFQPLKASLCWYTHKQKSFYMQIFIFLSCIHMPLTLPPYVILIYTLLWLCADFLLPRRYLYCCHHDQVIARVHSVHLVNVEQCQVAADPQTKPHDLGCESACFRQLASTVTIAIYYYYSARKLILIYHPTEGRRLSWPRHCRKGAHSPCPRL